MSKLKVLSSILVLVFVLSTGALAFPWNSTSVVQADSGSVTDSFADESMVASKLNLSITGGQVMIDGVLLSSVYGGADWDHFDSVYADSSYIYAAGHTGSEGQGYDEALLVKYNIADLSIAARKVYGLGSPDYFDSVYADSNYVYAAGHTYSEGQGNSDALLVKYNIGDLSIASRRVYGGGSQDYFDSVYADSSYIYAAGSTDSELQGGSDALLVKYNIGDLSIASRKVYGGGSDDRFHSVYADSSYIYAAGRTGSEGAGKYDTLLVKFNIADLSIDSRKVYGGFNSDDFYSVYTDSSYIYAAGRTGSEGATGDNALLVKYNIGDLSIAARKVYGGVNSDLFFSVYADSSYIYAAGYTDTEGQGARDALLVKFNIDDLSIASRKVYGRVTADYFYSVYADSSYIYAAGYTTPEGHTKSDALLVKFDIALPAETITDSCGLVCQDSGLTLGASNLTLAASNLTLAASNLTLAASNLTIADSDLTLATCEYLGSGILSSTNLLSGQGVSSIDSFGYSAYSVPTGTDLEVQFSEDNTNWYSSGGIPDGCDTCTEGTHSIDLSSLGWTSHDFYYKMHFTAYNSSSPVLDEVSVTFSPLLVGGEAYAVKNPAITAAWITFSAAIIFSAGMVLRRRRVKTYSQ